MKHQSIYSLIVSKYTSGQNVFSSKQIEEEIGRKFCDDDDVEEVVHSLVHANLVREVECGIYIFYCNGQKLKNHILSLEKSDSLQDVNVETLSTQELFNTTWTLVTESFDSSDTEKHSEASSKNIKHIFDNLFDDDDDDVEDDDDDFDIPSSNKTTNKVEEYYNLRKLIYEYMLKKPDYCEKTQSFSLLVNFNFPDGSPIKLAFEEDPANCTCFFTDNGCTYDYLSLTAEQNKENIMNILKKAEEKTSLIFNEKDNSLAFEIDSSDIDGIIDNLDSMVFAFVKELHDLINLEVHSQ